MCHFNSRTQVGCDLFPTKALYIPFQLPYPVMGRLRICIGTLCQLVISTHASHTRCGPLRVRVETHRVYFICRVRLQATSHVQAPLLISIHAPRAGGDIQLGAAGKHCPISTPASHEKCDIENLTLSEKNGNFNSRTPHGMQRRQ